jgi:hypothetical protein
MPLVTGPSSAIQPVQLPDMVGDYAKLAMLKNQLQEAPLRQQALQQQVQAGAIENQQRQTGIDSQKALMRAYSEAGGDLSKTVPLAAKYGASPDALVKLQQSAIEQQSANIKLLQEKGSRALQEADLYQGAHDAVAQAPAAQRPAAYQQQVQGLQQAGIDVSQLPPQYPGDEAFKTFGIALKGHKQQLEDLAQQANMGKTVAQTSESNAKANEANVNASLAPQKVANQVANDDTMRKQGAQRISIEQARLAFDQKKASMDQAQSGLTGDDFLGTLPAGLQSQVKAMANGDIAIPSASTRNPQAQQLRTAVLTYDPTYTDARYKGKQNFKTSGDAQNIVQLSTAMEHADKAIANSAKAGFAPALGSKTFESGQSAAYMQDAEFLTGEVGKLVKNGVLSVDESHRISDGLTSARQSVRDSALNETMNLLGGKARQMFQKYKASTGQDLPINDFFDAKSQQRLTKYGIVDGSTGSSDPFSQFGGKAH